MNCAPRIMSRIVREVLARNDRVRRATDHYIDDIIVMDDVVPAEEVATHLQSYGLVCKPPETLDGGCVLGLELSGTVDGALQFRRGNTVPLLDEDVLLTKRELFSICGKLVGHYPICGWLRVACSYLKRMCVGRLWQDPAGE